MSGGTPVTDESERKDTSNQYKGSPSKSTKLASGDTVNRRQAPRPNAIDDRVDIAHLINFLQESVQNSVDSRRDWQSGLETWYKQYKGVLKSKNFP
mgnify:FL=1